MTRQPTIRPFRPEEAEAFRRMRLKALAAHPEAFGNSVADEEADSMAKVTERLARGDTFAGFLDDDPVGMAGFFQETGEKRRHKGLLWGVYVEPALRGTGLAGRLVDAVLTHATGRVEMLYLGVGIANPAARRLYESRGFVAIGVEPHAFRLADRYVDELMMVRFMPGAPAPSGDWRAILSAL